MTAVVLTSENSAEHYAKILHLAPEPDAPAPAKAEGEASVESAEKEPAAAAEQEAAEQQADHPDPEKRQKLNLRFSELSQKIRDAEALAEKTSAELKAERDARELAERRAAELQTKYEPPKSDELGPKPTRPQFANDDEFATALEEWAGEKAVRDRDEQERTTQRVEAWGKRQTATKAELADYDAVIAQGANLEVSNAVREAILDSEVGPKMLYHLAKNPQLVAELKQIGDQKALIRIGKLEAKFDGEKPSGAASADVKTDAKPVVAATEISRAPAPISPLRGASTPVEALVDSKGEFHGTAAQWREARKAGKIR